MVRDHHPPCCYREQVAYALYAKFREPKLYHLAVSGDWDKIPSRCRSHPREASFVHRYYPNDTALHRILRANAIETTSTTCDNNDQSSSVDLDEDVVDQVNEIKMAAVKALLEANRQAAAIQDAKGRTPLHLACMDPSTLAVVSVIAEANPRAASVKDVEGRTPLHFVLSRHDDIPLELLQNMLQKCPAAVHMQDAVGETPLDICQRRKEEISNSQAVLELMSSINLPPQKDASGRMSHTRN